MVSVWTTLIWMLHHAIELRFVMFLITVSRRLPVTPLHDDGFDQKTDPNERFRESRSFRICRKYPNHTISQYDRQCDRSWKDRKPLCRYGTFSGMPDSRIWHQSGSKRTRFYWICWSWCLTEKFRCHLNPQQPGNFQTQIPVLLISYSIYCGVTRMHLWRFNLHKANAANEELVISLNYGREVHGRERIYRLLYHYTA